MIIRLTAAAIASGLLCATTEGIAQTAAQPGQNGLPTQRQPGGGAEPMQGSTGLAPVPTPSNMASRRPSLNAAADLGGGTGDADDVGATSNEAASAYVIPDAPAFTLLDVTPSAIDRPATLTKLGMSLANVITPEGTVRSGVAMEVSALALGLLDESSAYAYVENFWTRFAARSALSLGTVADSTTATTPAQTRLALGLRLVFIDESDPLLDPAYRSAGRRAIAACAGEEDLARRAACIQERYAPIFKELSAIRWNLGGLSAAFAQSFTFPESRVNDGDAGELGAWLSGAIGIGANLHLSAGGKYVRDIAAESTAITASARARVGTASFRGSLEGSYTHNSADNESLPQGRLSLGAELNVSESVWLVANVGSTIDQANLFAVSNIKWNLEPNPSF